MEENPEEPHSSTSTLKENPERVGSQKAEIAVVESSNELGQHGSCEEIRVEGSTRDWSGKLENLGGFKPDHPDGVSLEKAGNGVVEKGIEVGKDEVFKEVKVEDHPAGDWFEKVGSLGGLIEEEMDKVSLSGVPNSSVSGAIGFDKSGEIVGGIGVGVKSGEIASVSCEGDFGNDVKSGEVVRDDGDVRKSGDVLSIGGNGVKSGKMESDEDDSNGESESESGSSSSSSSSASSSSEDDDGADDDGDEEDEEEEEEEEEEGMEEIDGEMDLEEGDKSDSHADKMVAWSDDEEDGDGSSAIQGPIRSKNEREDLPPVPPLNVTLQPYHQTLPVGVVLSIIGAKVIVEGMEKHSPLNEGSILWITEIRSPLGLVDEIFGPVKNPYYVVRYNSESDVPAGIQQGTLISFVPEFSNHVLNDSSLYMKGYDASGENDEALDEAEFSDDEKEAEYRRMLKTTKRGTNDQKSENKKKDKKKFKTHDGNWRNGQPPKPHKPAGLGQPSIDQNQLSIPPVTATLGHRNCPYSFDSVQSLASGSSFRPSFPQAPGFNSPSNGVWTNAISCQQPQSMGFSNGFPTNVMVWQQQNHPQQPQMPLPNGLPFQQQFNPTSQMLPNNFVLPVGQANFVTGSPLATWSAGLGQTGFNQPPLVMGLQGQHAFQSMNVGSRVLPNVVQTEHNYNLLPPSFVSGNNGTCQEFSQGVYSSHGRKPYHRGGGRFGGGRGRHQSK